MSLQGEESLPPHVRMSVGSIITAAVCTLAVFGTFALGLAVVFVVLSNRQKRPSPAVLAAAAVAQPAAPAPQPTAPAAQPAAPARMQVTEMAVTGFIGIAYPDGTKREEQLPTSPKGEGEFPTGIHIDDAGDIFVVGKLYGGRSEPDDGVVYKREASTGATTSVFTQPERTFGSVTGRGCGELYVGAIGGIAVCLSGEWRFVELPEYPMLWEVFRDGDDLIAQSFDGLIAKELRRGSTTQTYPRPQPIPRANRVTVRGVTYSAFDRSVEVGAHLLTQPETSALRGEMDELGRALADGSARVRKLS